MVWCDDHLGLQKRSPGPSCKGNEGKDKKGKKKDREERQTEECLSFNNLFLLSHFHKITLCKTKANIPNKGEYRQHHLNRNHDEGRGYDQKHLLWNIHKIQTRGTSLVSLVWMCDWSDSFIISRDFFWYHATCVRVERHSLSFKMLSSPDLALNLSWLCFWLKKYCLKN